MQSGWNDALPDEDEISWTWEDWIPDGYVAMIAAEAGVGKSLVALRLGASALMQGLAEQLESIGGRAKNQSKREGKE